MVVCVVVMREATTLGRPTADDMLERRAAAAPPGYGTRRAPLEQRQDRQGLQELQELQELREQQGLQELQELQAPGAGRRANRLPAHRLAADVQAGPHTGSVHT